VREAVRIIRPGEMTRRSEPPRRLSQGDSGATAGRRDCADPSGRPQSGAVHGLTIDGWILVGAAALIASTLAAVAGFGGAAVLLPVLVVAVGVRDAVPVLTVAQLIGNASRVWFNREKVDLPVVGWFAAGGVPLAFLGGLLFAQAPLSALTRLLGAFLIVVVAWRRMRPGAVWRPPLRSFAVIGAVASFLSALLGSVGPVMAPFFLAYGLVKGAYIGTEALATVVMHVTKLVAYRQAAVLSPIGTVTGLAIGPIMILGSYLGKRIVDRISARAFVLLIELTMTAAGLLFLIRGR
jgi:uncharacterized membrane protein YfcA